MPHDVERKYQIPFVRHFGKLRIHFAGALVGQKEDEAPLLEAEV